MFSFHFTKYFFLLSIPIIIIIIFFLFCFCLQDGQRGHLEGLATVYVELLDAPFNEVLNGLENARQAAWAEQSPQHRSGMYHQGHRGSSSQGSLPNSHSQPIYVPGKYSVSINADSSTFIPMHWEKIKIKEKQKCCITTIAKQTGGAAAWNIFNRKIIRNELFSWLNEMNGGANVF